MKIISPDILDALHRMKIQFGTNVGVARKLGVSSKHVGKILTEDVKYFEDKTWERIEPLIVPYIRFNSDSAVNLTQEEKEVIEYLRKPENRRDFLELLLKIEDSRTHLYRHSRLKPVNEVPAVKNSSACYAKSRK